MSRQVGLGQVQVYMGKIWVGLKQVSIPITHTFYCSRAGLGRLAGPV